MRQPIKPTNARALFRNIVENGAVEFSPHAQQEMVDDDLESTDCVNVLRGGVVQPPELEKGEWRYRVTTNRICVVVALDGDKRLRVVTVWRVRQ